jgi:hypothetical protein
MQWKFLFLRLLYVTHTKKVLLWLDREGPKTRKAFYADWQESIRNEKELDTMLRLLIRYGTVRGSKGRLEITEHGRDFLRYLGWK